MPGFIIASIVMLYYNNNYALLNPSLQVYRRKKGRNVRPFYRVFYARLVFWLLYGMRMFDVDVLLTKATANHHKEDRNKEDSQQRCGDHPAHYTGTYGVL